MNVDFSSSSRRDSPNVPANTASDASPALDLGVHYSASLNIDNNMPEARNIQNATRGILAPKSADDRRTRRNLRPRIERSYAESPDEPRINGYINGNVSDNDDGWFQITTNFQYNQFVFCFFHFLNKRNMC